jgi:hypothetical protein
MITPEEIARLRSAMREAPTSGPLHYRRAEC